MRFCIVPTGWRLCVVSFSDPHQHMLSPSNYTSKHSATGDAAVELTPDHTTSLLARHRRSAPSGSACSLHPVLLRVRDLGLGYDSDESILFKYCSGSCPRVPSNHDLTLAYLLLSGVLVQHAPTELQHHAPCCRPTHHEDVAFLDNAHRWHKVEQLAAAGCDCVG